MNQTVSIQQIAIAKAAQKRPQIFMTTKFVRFKDEDVEMEESADKGHLESMEIDVENSSNEEAMET